MAFDSPPFAMDSSVQDAALFRRALGTLITAAGGLVSAGDLAVTQQATPNMSVQIGTGQIWIPGSSAAGQGPYYSRNGASITQPISTANASNPRVDTILAQVIDATYAGSGQTCAPGYVMGTPTAGATLTNLTGIGVVPASSLVLAYVLVPAAATSIVTADISNVATTAKLGLNAWTPVNGAWVTPALGSGVTAGTPTPPQYMKDAIGFVHLRGSFTLATTGTYYPFTLPAGFRPGASDYYFGVAGPSGTYLQITTAGLLAAGVPAANDPITMDGAVNFLAEN